MASLQFVGAYAIIQGIRSFEADAKSVVDNLHRINDASNRLARDGSGAFNLFGGIALTTFDAVRFGAEALTIAIVGVGAAVTTTTAILDRNLKLTQAVTDSTTSQIKELGDVVRAVAREAQIPLPELSVGAGELVRAGVDIEDVLGGALRSTQQLTEALAGEGGMQRAALTVAAAMQVFGISGRDSQRVVNSIAAAVVNSGATFIDFDRSFRQIAPVAALVGLTVEETSTLVGLMGRQFLRGSDAGTSLKTTFLKLLNPSKASLEVMKEFGISLETANGQIINGRQLIGQLADAFSDQAVASGRITAAERNRALTIIFQNDAVRAAAILSKAGTKEFDEFFKSIARVDVSKMASTLQNSLIPQLGILINILNAASTEIGQVFLPTLTQAATDINTALRSIKPSVFRALGAAIETIVGGRAPLDLLNAGTQAFGENWSKVFESAIRVGLAFRDMILTSIIPSFSFLLKTIAGASGGTSGLAGFLNSIASAIRNVSAFIITFSATIGTMINRIKDAAENSDILRAALGGITKLPLVGIALVIGNIGLALLGIITPIVVAGAAIGLMTKAIQSMASKFDGSIDSIIKNFNEMDLVMKVATVSALGLATVLTVNVLGSMVAIALGSARLLAAITGLNVIIPILARIGIAFTLMAANAVIALGAILVPALPVIAIIATIGLAAFLLYKTWTTNFLGIRDVTNNVVSGVVKFLSLLVDTTISALGIVSDAFSRAMKLVESVTVDGLNSTSGQFAKFANFLVQVIGVGAARAFVVNFSNSLSGLEGNVVDILNTVSEKFAKFAVFVSGVPGIGAFVGVLSQGLNLVASGARSFDSFTDTINNALGSITNTFKGLELGVSDAFGTVGKSLDDLRKSTDGFLQGVVRDVDKARESIGELTPDLDALREQLDALRKLQLEGAKSAEDEARRIKALLDSLAGETGELGFPDSGGAGKDSKTERVKQLTAAIQVLLDGLPGANKELAEFLAQLEEETPGRLGAMVLALREQTTLLAQAILTNLQLLQIVQQIEQTEKRINVLSAQRNLLDLQAQQATIGFRQRSLALQQQQLALEIQMAPLRAQIRDIEREIAALQRENYDLTKARLDAELELLPLKNQIEDIDARIAAVRKEDLKLQLEAARINQQLLPQLQQMASIERMITDLVNERQRLTLRKEQLLAEGQVADIESRIEDVEANLEDAWNNFDAEGIIANEQLLETLKGQLKEAQSALGDIRKEQEDQARAEELAQIPLQLQIVTLKELIRPLQDRLQIIKDTQDAQQAAADVAELVLRIEKDAIEALIEPIERRLELINRQSELDKARAAIVIIDLEREKQAILDQLQPLQDRHDALQDEISIIGQLQQAEELRFESLRLQNEAELLQYQLRRAELELNRLKQQEVFDNLAVNLVNALIKSRAFTADESVEVAKRIGLYNEQVGRILATVSALNEMKIAAEAAKAALDAIPRTVDVTVNYHSNGVGAGAGAGGGTSTSTQGFTQQGVPTSAEAASNRASFATNNVTNNTTINVDANYGRVQQEGSIRRDLSAIIQMVGR